MATETAELQPAWNHPDPVLSVRLLFAQPYWIAADPAGTGEGWKEAMAQYQIYLDQIASVKEWGITIYGHLRSRNMPKTHDPAEYWPDAATELLRLWINQGWRATETDPLDRAERIPPPCDKPDHVRIREDIRALTERELNDYRARIEEVMRAPDPSPDSPWQKMAYVHTNWCLHYQEAFLFWHRAYLVYFEQVLGIAVPFWNWMAEDADADGSPDAGIPRAFLEPTYLHPVTGETRPNPLRFAAAKDGRSKACAGGANGIARGADCRWVQRNPLFSTSGDDHRAEREKLFRMVRIFQNQVVNALRWPVFSQPEGSPGYPWANILTFDPPSPTACIRTGKISTAFTSNRMTTGMGGSAPTWPTMPLPRSIRCSGRTTRTSTG
jgi:tyrosinase